ncbi:MAG: ABC-2 family transporter protein [Methanomassiliicoccales archaeon PtaU1.Bin124]|nr:MAG: ABC-2 family transporter protein [Methanomassiliicoccales archaeon PtaU1.Bin124]
MSSGKVWQAFKENMKGMWPARFIALVVVASIIISLFGLAFEKGPTQDISVDVVNMDSATVNSTASMVVGVMDSGTTVNIISTYRSSDTNALQTALDDLKSGKVEAVIFFGQNFTSDITAWMLAAKNGTSIAPSSLVLYMDASNPIASAAVQGEVQRSVQVVLASTFKLSSPVRVMPNIVYGEGTDMRDFMSPAIAGLLIFILTLMPTLMSSMNGGTVRDGRYTAGERISAQILSSLVVGAVLATTILLVMAAFGIRMVGDMSVTFTLLALLAMASSGLGLLLATVTKKAPAATMVIFPLVLYPAILLGGIILPISSIPDYLLPISYLFPLTYAIDGTRLSMLDGFGWDGCWVQVLSLLVYVAICVGIAWYFERHARSEEVEKK